MHNLSDNFKHGYYLQKIGAEDFWSVTDGECILLCITQTVNYTVVKHYLGLCNLRNVIFLQVCVAIAAPRGNCSRGGTSGRGHPLEVE